MKQCLKCGEVKPLKEFFRQNDRRRRRRGDGYRGVCKTCFNQNPSRSSRYREAERRRSAAKSGRPFLTLAERAARRIALQPSARDKQLRRLHRLMRVLLKARCAQQGMEFSTIQFRTRYRNDPVFRESQIARTWARKAASGVLRTDKRTTRNVSTDGTLTPIVVRGLFAAAKKCPYCRHPLHPRRKTLDHVMPVSRGGIHSITNVLVCCLTCNARKGTRTPAEMGWSIAQKL